MKQYEIDVYTTENGIAPFQEWLENIKDMQAQTRIFARLERAKFGNFGDFKKIKGAKGLLEFREHHHGGLRIYFSIIENTIVLLLAGSTKKDQDKAIRKAKEYLEDYERRTDHG